MKNRKNERETSCFNFKPRNQIPEFFQIYSIHNSCDPCDPQEFCSQTLTMNSLSQHTKIHKFVTTITFTKLIYESKVIMYRSRYPEVFCKKGVLRNFIKFTRKHPCRSNYFNKVVSLHPVPLLKRHSGTDAFKNMFFMQDLRATTSKQ